MAWISGLDIFDSILNSLLNRTNNDLKAVIKALIIEFESRGCDIIQSSNYFDNPLVRDAYTELHPGWNVNDDEEDTEERTPNVL